MQLWQAHEKKKKSTVPLTFDAYVNAFLSEQTDVASDDLNTMRNRPFDLSHYKLVTVDENKKKATTPGTLGPNAESLNLDNISIRDLSETNVSNIARVINEILQDITNLPKLQAQPDGISNTIAARQKIQWLCI